MKYYFRYLKMCWYFRKKLAQLYIFDLDYDDIICLKLNEREYNFLADEAIRDFGLTSFCIGGTINSNIKDILLAKYKPTKKQ